MGGAWQYSSGVTACTYPGPQWQLRHLRPAMSDDLDDESQDAYAVEGIQAFNRMTAAMHGLNARMTTLDAGLNTKVSAAEKAATLASTAAHTAKQAATEAHAAVREERRSLALWTSGLVALAVLLAGALGYHLGQRAGETVGQANGYRSAMDEKAAASWANTPSGQLALALDRAGSLAMLATCSGKGWETQTRQGRRVCFVKPDAKGNIYGWTLP